MQVGVDDGASELRLKLTSLEHSSVHSISEWEGKIAASRDELARVTEQNTRWLDKVAKLTKAQYDLEDTLNHTTKNVHVADSSPLDDQSDMERRQLLELVQLQEREIDALKSEIHVLRSCQMHERARQGGREIQARAAKRARARRVEAVELTSFSFACSFSLSRRKGGHVYTPQA